MIVADVNLIVYLLTDTPQHRQAIARYTEDPDWRVPPLWRHEFLNVLATLARHTVISEEDAVTLWHNALMIFGGQEGEANWVRSLSIAIAHGVSAYDAQYIALAEELDCAVITNDNGLQRTFPSRCRGLE